MRGVFLDAGLFIALVFDDDNNHQRALDLVKDLISGRFGRPLQVSVPVIIEALAMIHRKTRGSNKQLRSLEKAKFILQLLQTYRIEIHYVDEQWYRQANLLYESYGGNLDFVDALNVVYLRLNNVSQIASFDSHYDQFADEGLKRIC